MHFCAIGFGCWSTGNITDDMVDEYLAHHRKTSGDDQSDFTLEWETFSLRLSYGAFSP